MENGYFVCVVLFDIGPETTPGTIACKVTAETQEAATAAVQNDRYSKNARNTKVLGTLRIPAVLCRLPYVPSVPQAEYRNESHAA